jgi:hypothetical protein
LRWRQTVLGGNSRDTGKKLEIAAAFAQEGEVEP